jgi:hypothetical protein
MKGLGFRVKGLVRVLGFKGATSCAPGLLRWKAKTAPTHIAGTAKSGNTYTTRYRLRMNARPWTKAVGKGKGGGKEKRWGTKTVR